MLCWINTVISSFVQLFLFKFKCLESDNTFLIVLGFRGYLFLLSYSLAFIIKTVFNKYFLSLFFSMKLTPAGGRTTLSSALITDGWWLFCQYVVQQHYYYYHWWFLLQMSDSISEIILNLPQKNNKLFI